jgi:type I restriction enzyme, S subunit
MKQYPAYPKYKPSGVEWLGDVTEQWWIKPFRRIIFSNGQEIE